MTAVVGIADALEVPCDALGSTVPIARGGTATVEAVSQAPLGAAQQVVLKRYHEPALVDSQALLALIRWRRELSHADRARLDRIASWPLAAVSEGGAIVGFVMHRVSQEFVEAVRLPSGRRRDVLREAQYLVASREHARRLGLAELAVRTRREIAWSLAEAVSFMHRRRIVLGDLSTRNVLWAAGPGRVHLVDCDSMVLGGVGSPLPAATTVDWDDPAQPIEQAATSDVYKLALLVLRLFSRSFQTRDAAAADSQLDPTGRWLVRASLSNNPDERPHAAAWERWAASRRAAARPD